MSTKKKIIFIINDLRCGGAEKALVSLLNSINYSLCEVDLLLFKQEGLFLNQVPSEVTLLAEPLNYSFFDMPLKKVVLENLKRGKFKIIYNRICAGILLRMVKDRSLAEQKMWKFLSPCLPRLAKKYDVAIGYLEKTPNYYCIDKVSSELKLGFIHNDYNQLKMDVSLDFPYFNKFDKVVTVSEECLSVLKDNFSDLSHKFEVMHNIISAKAILKLSKDSVDFKRKGITLMSVGRLNFQKGYDLALEACKILVDKGIHFSWYVLGEGEERENLQKQIVAYHLEDYFILLGLQENPYAYLAHADIFVHTARFEGFGIVISEAKIMKKPMVITNFNIAQSHIDHGKNGLIAAMTPESIAANLEQLLLDSSLREVFSESLSKGNYGTESEINKFYELIELENTIGYVV